MRTLYLLLFIFFSATSFGQHYSRIDFDAIKKAVEDSSGTFYYPHLINRMVEQDTTMTTEDFKHIYYGNIYQSYYYPYGSTDMEKNFEHAYLQNNNFERIEELGLAVLAENPVNLKVLLKMIFLYNHTKSVEKVTRMAILYVGLLQVIYGSGTGVSCEDSFVVISVDDEYAITSDLGLTVVRQALIGSCDRLFFSKKGQHRKNRIKTLYFNVKMPLAYLSKSFINSDVPVPDQSPDDEE